MYLIQGNYSFKFQTYSKIVINYGISYYSFRTIASINVHTESESLSKVFGNLLGRKPNFDSSLTLLQNDTVPATRHFVAKQMSDWTTLDMGWTNLPPSVMSVYGYLTGINPDLVRIMAKHLGLHINFQKIPSFEENVEVLT